MEAFLIIAIVFTCFLILGVVLVAAFVANKDRKRKPPKDRTERKGTDFPSFSYPIDYGTEGELLTMNELTKIPGYKKVFHSCYIPTIQGHTTEADIIMVHEGGIFVIECKNYSGWIKGSEEEEKWIQYQVKNEGLKEKEFYNPIRQNDTHLKYLNKYLNEDVPYYSYIVFVGDCSIKKVELQTSLSCFCKLEDLVDSIENVLIDDTERLSVEEVDRLALKVEKLTNVDNKTILRHQMDVYNHKSKSGY